MEQAEWITFGICCAALVFAVYMAVRPFKKKTSLDQEWFRPMIESIRDATCGVDAPKDKKYYPTVEEALEGITAEQSPHVARCIKDRRDQMAKDQREYIQVVEDRIVPAPLSNEYWMEQCTELSDENDGLVKRWNEVSDRLKSTEVDRDGLAERLKATQKELESFKKAKRAVAGWLDEAEKERDEAREKSSWIAAKLEKAENELKRLLKENDSLTLSINGLGGFRATIKRFAKEQETLEKHMCDMTDERDSFLEQLCATKNELRDLRDNNHLIPVDYEAVHVVKPETFSHLKGAVDDYAEITPEGAATLKKTKPQSRGTSPAMPKDKQRPADPPRYHGDTQCG